MSQTSSSPLRSLVDLACGSFGSVVLLALVLVRVAPLTTSGTVSGRVVVRIPAGPVFPTALLESWCHSSLVLDGQTLEALGPFGKWKSSAVLPAEEEAGDGGVVRWTSRVTDDAALAQRVLELDLGCVDFAEPHVIEWTLWYGAPDGPLAPGSFAPSFVQVTAGGTIVPESVALSLASADGRMIVRGDQGGRQLKVTLTLGEEVGDLDAMIQVRAHK